ncbi:cytochrome P450 [Caldimonas thermodepolymerans]|jgi:cytochrome P450|uniref:cytochrome P450 n=1 Tax=Caldimonas thermodepolymerans TaxID=215580 RepID=UPI002235E07A|nr:cytochrome P450 [Caldimonas thermodepolymerans]UZG46055.1 cytochrome P450 [Caldimonas thermodepolymerans]
MNTMTEVASVPARTHAEKLEQAYAAVSDTYRGKIDDIYAASAKMRKTTRVYEGDWIANFLGVPTNAGLQAGTRPTFAVFQYQDVMNVLKDADTFTNGFILEGLGKVWDGIMILGMDGPVHRQLRALLQPAFMPENVNRWRPKIERVLREDFVKPMLGRKQADLMEMGLYFPVRVMYALVGFPEDKPEEYAQYAAWALSLVAANQIDKDKAEEGRRIAAEAVKKLYDVLIPQVKKRRAEGGTGDDLISRLINAEYEGRKLDDHEVATFARSLLPAAGETTTRTFGAAMTLLLTVPGLLERVRNDRTLVPKLIDETVRYEPSSTFKVRETAVDTEIGGVKIPKGSFVQCIVASANRDDSVFENADTFDIDRRQKPSFGFGFGPHMCIGQFVAKLEINCAINALLDLCPNLRLDPSKPAPKIEGAHLRGPKHVHVIWD